jgi:hypothetical protein
MASSDPANNRQYRDLRNIHVTDEPTRDLVTSTTSRGTTSLGF